MAQSQKQLLIQSQEVMSHFCYAFSLALLKKLCKMVNERALFEKYERLTPLTISICQQLADQIHYSWTSSDGAPGVVSLVNTAEAFLAIFEIG